MTRRDWVRILVSLMAIASTDPKVLVQNAKCFLSCLTPKEQLGVQTYLLAVVAGVPTDAAGVKNLVQQAKCFLSCVPPSEQLPLQNYLLAQLAS